MSDYRYPAKKPRQRRKPKAQTVAQTTVQTRVPVGTLVPQPHGGALRYGGTNKGGPGRPPTELRRTLRDLLDTGGIAYLAECARGDRDDEARRWATETLLRYGLGTRDEITTVSADVQMRLQRQADAILETCPPEVAAVLAQRLREIWG